MFFVTRDNPRAIDLQFAEAFPALGLRPTTNSGALWGDGDLRARHVDYDRLQFALESKCRFAGEAALPRAAEWTKAVGASGQLYKRSRSVVALFLVYSATSRLWSVSIPVSGLRLLESCGVETTGLGEHRAFKRRTGDELPYVLFYENDWLTLYDRIRSALGAD